MPTTIMGLLIIVFVILPGIPANSIYMIFIGSDWRVTEWEKISKTVGFSLIGVILYICIASIFNFPQPIYLIPSTFSGSSFNESSLIKIAIPLVFHFLSSCIVALLAVFVVKLIYKWSPSTPYPSVWDEFIRTDVLSHWVVVRLQNGEAFTGYIKNADTSVKKEERDIILAEPAFYCEGDYYEVLPYQQLFLSSEIISSIAVVYNKQLDNRIIPVGSRIETKEIDDA